MTFTSTIYVGTVGEGVWRSRYGGDTFSRIANGMFVEADVRALAVHPRDANTIYAGTNAGIYRTSDAGDHWERLPAPFDVGEGWPGGVIVWSLLVDPFEPATIFAGLCPGAIWRSRDAGETWQELSTGIARECGGIKFSRVTCLVADYMHLGVVYAGVEIDGLFSTYDGGETWRRLGKGLSSQDIHGIAVVQGVVESLVLTTNNDVNSSSDGGLTWQPLGVGEQFQWRYCRGIIQATDRLIIGNGDGPPGTDGAIQLMRPGWKPIGRALMEEPPNSTIWTFAGNSRTGELAAATVLGYIYGSTNDGESWSKLLREFGEIRSLAIT